MIIVVVGLLVPRSGRVVSAAEISVYPTNDGAVVRRVGRLRPECLPISRAEMEWAEPGPDVWGFVERVWRRLKRVDRAA